MRKPSVFPGAIALALCWTTAGAEETRCTGPIGPSLLDNIVVPDHRACALEGTRAKGSVRVGTGATLQAQGVHVNGNIQAEGARAVTLGRDSHVGGSIQIKQGGGALIADKRISGDLQFDANSRRLSAAGNTIGGNLQAVGNRGGVSLSGNAIDGNLQCKENRPAPTGADNRASSKQDQCAGL